MPPPELQPINPDAISSPVDTVYASMPEMAKDQPEYNSVEGLLKDYHWNCVKNEVYSIMVPADTFYREIRQASQTWEFDFKPIGWGFPIDSLVGGDLIRYVESGWSSIQFELKNDRLEFSREQYFFQRPTRYQDSSFSFELMKTSEINDSVMRVAVLKLKSIPKPVK